MLAIEDLGDKDDEVASLPLFEFEAVICFAEVTGAVSIG